MPEISEVNAYSLELPLREPFGTAKGTKTTSPAVIVHLGLSNGVYGLGSATPAKYVTAEDTASVLSAIELCAPDLVGLDAAAYLPIFGMLGEVLPHAHSARAALEIAVLDAFCKLYDLPMCKFLGGALPQVETDITIPFVGSEAARELAQQAASRGFKHLKIKIGSHDPEDDLARVLGASEGAPHCSIRLDANQGFTPTVAVRFAGKIQEAGVKIDLFEQPVDRRDLDGLRYVTQNTSVPIFADESAVTPSDVLKLIELEAVDGINVKLMKCGLSGALDIIAMCKAARQELMLGCMVETGIGLAAAVHLACGTGAFSRIDLDAHMLVSPDSGLSSGGFTHNGPVLIADSTAPGHGSALATTPELVPSQPRT
ncbi:MAG TPA: dipeptide epimerase [Armatimonadota bacterium]|nr:dipeptide epimerase [Armatimonadota bacterium]